MIEITNVKPVEYINMSNEELEQLLIEKDKLLEEVLNTVCIIKSQLHCRGIEGKEILKRNEMKNKL